MFLYLYLKVYVYGVYRESFNDDITSDYNKDDDTGISGDNKDSSTDTDNLRK